MGDTVMKQSLLKLLVAHEYAKASEIFFSQSEEDGKEVLVDLAYETENESMYSFVCYLLEQKKSVFLHALAAELLIHPLVFLDDAYLTAMYHVRQAIDLEPNNVELMELMIFFSMTPDQVLSREAAEEYAKRILSIEPNNKAALQFIRGK